MFRSTRAKQTNRSSTLNNPTHSSQNPPMKNLRSPKLLALGAVLLAGTGYLMICSHTGHTAAPVAVTAGTAQAARAVTSQEVAAVTSAPVVAATASAMTQAGELPAVASSSQSVRLQAGLVLPPQAWDKFTPKHVTIEAVTGLPVEFSLASSHTEQGRTINVYRNDIPGAFVTTAATADEMVGEVVVPFADTYALRVNSTGVSYTVQPHVPLGANDAITQPVAAALAKTAASPAPRGEVAAAPAMVVAASPATVTVDVGFCATAATITANGGAASMQTTLLAKLASCNQYLVNSGIDMIWRMSHLQQVADYATTNLLVNDLNSIAVGGANYAAIKTVEDADYTDLEVMVVGGGVSDRDSAGQAFLGGRQAAVMWYSDPSLSLSSYILAHELGHNYGINHDRSTDNVPDTVTGYNYGYRFMVQALDAGSRPPRTFAMSLGDIMAYDTRVPYFSTPLKTYSDADNTGIVLGVAEGTQGPDYGAGYLRAPADASRYIREQMATVAATRSAPTQPAITTQPVCVSVRVGAAINLSVTATGGNLTYVWRKDGVAIANATSASYSKTAALTDAGSYTVVVTNSAGSVTSTSATVTVTAAPVVTPPNGGSSGGGGGGAMSEWFVAVLGALYGLKCLSRRGR
jgi:hypothetical protein